MSVNSLCRPRIAIAFCVLVLLVPLHGAESKAGAEQARQEWMTGYLKLEHANKAVEEERTASALQLFEEALAVFQQVRDSAPDWQPQLVNYRIAFCEERIQALRETAALGLEKMSPRQLRSEIQRLRQELSGPKARIEQLEADVERLTVKTASTNSARELAEERAAKAEADLRADEAQITDLSRRAEELATSLARRNETVKTLEDAMANTATLSATVAELERRAKAGADATRRCEALESQLAALEKERQRLASSADVEPSVIPTASPESLKAMPSATRDLLDDGATNERGRALGFQAQHGNTKDGNAAASTRPRGSATSERRQSHILLCRHGLIAGKPDGRSAGA